MPTIILTDNPSAGFDVREKRAVALLIAFAAGLQLLCVPGHYLGHAQDDILYILAARSLLAGGYTLGISPGLPPLTEITPGWPLLLVPAAAVSGDSPAGYQIWAWLWLVLCDVLVWMWLRRRMDARGAAAATALFALNPLMLSYAGVVMSEVPFIAVMMALLLRLESRSGLRGWQSGLGLGFAWLVRSGALPLFPAVWGWYLWRRRYRGAAQSVVVSLGIMALWNVWVVAIGRPMPDAAELAMTLPGQGASGMAGIALWNVSHALTLWGRTMLPWAAAPGSPAALIAGAALALVAAAGLAPLVRERRYEAAAVFLAGGVVMHALWPWWYVRYLTPFLPFLVWGVWASLNRLTRRWAPALLAAAAFLPLPVQGMRLVSGASARQRPELTRTYRWIRENTPASSLLTSPFYARDAFYAGRPFIPLPVTTARPTDEPDLPGRLRGAGVDYLLWQDMPDIGSSLGSRFIWTRRLREFESDLAGSGLPAVFSNTAEGTTLYKITYESHAPKSLKSY